MFGRSELNDMWNAICGIILFGATCLLCIGWLIWFVFSYKSLECDYKTTVVVDDSSKVEWAVSNVMNDVKARNFVVTKIEVETWHDQSFRVTCGGVSQANFLKR